jgi:hypothetical protein
MSSTAFNTLAAGTVRKTFSSVCLTFREHGRPNPSKDKDPQSCFLLQQQYQSYVNDDPTQKQQKAIPMCIISKMAKQKITELQQVIGQLTTMHSLPCDHANTSKSPRQRSNKPTSSAFATSGFSRTEN